MSFEAKITQQVAQSTIGDKTGKPPAAGKQAPEPDEPEELEDQDEGQDPDESEEPDLDGGEDEDEDEDEDSAEASGESIDPEKTYLVDGEEVQGKDLIGSKFRHADYTRKTQELAALRKELQGKQIELEDELDEAVTWAKSLGNVDRMEYELETLFPEAYERLKDRIIEQALEESELKDDKSRQYYNAARKARLEGIARKANEEYEQAKAAKAGQRARVAEIRENVNKWTVSAMKVTGLDINNADHRTALLDRLAVGYHNVAWTEEIVAQAAKKVAALLKIEPPKAEEEAAKARLPKVRGAGHKSPPQKIKEVQVARKRASAPKSFDELRKSYGVS